VGSCTGRCPCLARYGDGARTWMAMAQDRALTGRIPRTTGRDPVARLPDPGVDRLSSLDHRKGRHIGVPPGQARRGYATMGAHRHRGNGSSRRRRKGGRLAAGWSPRAGAGGPRAARDGPGFASQRAAVNRACSPGGRFFISCLVAGGAGNGRRHTMAGPTARSGAAPDGGRVILPDLVGENA